MTVGFHSATGAPTRRFSGGHRAFLFGGLDQMGRDLIGLGFTVGFSSLTRWREENEYVGVPWQSAHRGHDA